MRLDVMFRVGPTTDTLTARYDVGGASDTGNVTVSLTHGLYVLADLVTEVDTQLAAQVDPALNCDFDGEYVRISSGVGPTNDVTWDHPGLRDWLGFSGNLTGAAAYTAGAICPGRFTASHPWDAGDPLGWVWHIKRRRGRHQSGGSVKVGRQNVWRVNAFVVASELEQFRTVLAYILRGLPARWYRDTSVGTAWTFGNWSGYVDVMMSPDQRRYVDQWARSDLHQHLTVPLELQEYTG